MDGEPTFTAFLGSRQVAYGDIGVVATAAAAAPQGAVLIFDDTTGRPIDLDLRGGPEAAAASYLARSAPSAQSTPRRSGRGRPRLGVVAREVTLLPRHWDWLARQPGGASAALRRLVEEARRSGADDERAREAHEALYRVMSVLAGDAPGFEAATRALFAGDDAGFDAIVATWAPDVSAYLTRLAQVVRRARPAE